MLPGLARIEGVGGPGDRGCIVDVRPVFRGRSIFRHSFFILFFYCFLSQFVFHFDGFCGAILAFKKDPNGSSGPSWRILAASWPLFRVIPTQKSALTRLICFCEGFSTVFGMEKDASKGKKVWNLYRKNSHFLLSDHFDIYCALEFILVRTWFHFGLIFAFLEYLGAPWGRLGAVLGTSGAALPPPQEAWIFWTILASIFWWF